MNKLLLAVLMSVSTLSSATWWAPSVGEKMYINYVDQFGMANAKFLAATVVNIDLEDNSTARIAQIKATGREVICYFSAGSWENWRADQALFPDVAKGNTMSGWPNERWVDIRNADIVTIMKARIDLAATKGCNAVDPDNTDAWDGNNPGFPITQLHTQTYLATLANYAHSVGLGMGLKNNPNIVNTMFTYFDFGVVEQCHEFNECGSYLVLPNYNKPVFQIEYTGTFTNICNAATIHNFDAQKKTLDLNNAGTHCP